MNSLRVCVSTAFAILVGIALTNSGNSVQPAADVGSNPSIASTEGIHTHLYSDLTRDEAHVELERGGAIATLGDPAKLRNELGIPHYAVSDPGLPLLGYAIRKLPNGRYADIYVCESIRSTDPFRSSKTNTENNESVVSAPTSQEILWNQIAQWLAQGANQSKGSPRISDGPSNGWLYGHWVRWVQVPDGYQLAYALIDFTMYQLADNQSQSDFFLCDVRLETSAIGLGIDSRGLRLNGKFHDTDSDSTYLLEHGPSTTEGTTSTSYETGWSVSGSLTEVGADYSSSVTHSWASPDVLTLNMSITPQGIAEWMEVFTGGGGPRYYNFVSFPSAIFRVDDLENEMCRNLVCKLRVDAQVNFAQGVVLNWEGGFLSWGYPQGPEIFDFWPPSDPDPVNVGEFVDFSVVAADLNGCDLMYTWRLDDKVVGTDPDYRYTAECYHPGAMRLEVEVRSPGGMLTRDWTLRVNNSSRIPPSTPILIVEDDVRVVPSLGDVVLRAGVGGASEFIWSTTCGTIIGDGTVVTYRAPVAHPDTLTCQVSVTAANSCGSSSPSEVSFQIAPATSIFVETAPGIPSVSRGCAAWGDSDNDEDFDILLCGMTDYYERISEVYCHGELGSFTRINAGLAGVSDGAAAWGDYDNDGNLDILLAGDTGSERVTLVYRNDGTGSYTDIGAGLQGVSNGTVAWGDYDNDGDLDILVSGYTGSESPAICTIYRNDNGGFTDIVAGLPGVMNGSTVWGDYDNDGDLDLLITGEVGVGGSMSRVYRNDTGSFTDIVAGLPGVAAGSTAWGDYDNDGDLDILLTGSHWTGSPVGSGPISRVYRNDGSGVFTDIVAGLEGTSSSSTAWGDYDNDGDLDILLVGGTNSHLVSLVYRNDSGSFTAFPAGLTGVHQCSAVWGDYDTDGDLDILLTGLSDWTSGEASLLYTSLLSLASENTPPMAPANLASQLVGEQLTLSWDAATDAQTPSLGLSYSLRVGTTPGGSEVCSPMASAESGYRRLPQLGNAQQRTSWTITVPDSTQPYYWSVQAVDGAYAGSPFAEERPTSVTSGPGVIPRATRLHSPVPNPFNPSTLVTFDLVTEETVTLRIYDVSGHLIRTLVNRALFQAGQHEIPWNGLDNSGRRVAAGIYFCRMDTGQFSDTKRLALVK